MHHRWTLAVYKASPPQPLPGVSRPVFLTDLPVPLEGVPSAGFFVDVLPGRCQNSVWH